MSRYEKQANDFLEKTGTTFKAEFIAHKKHFQDDEDERDVYLITFEKNGRAKTLEFGQSLNCSGQWIAYLPKGEREYINDKKRAISLKSKGVQVSKNKDFEIPNAYGVLSVIVKEDPDTFDVFCSNFGYDTDSRKAEVIYKAVMNEWDKVQMLWSEKELELLREIQ